MDLRMFLCFMLMAFTCAGCSVVQKGTDVPAYDKLATWKAKGSGAAAGEKYNTARTNINAWITAKQTQLAIAGAQPLTQVKLDDFPERLQQDVDALGVSAPPDSTITDVLDWLVGKYKQSRKDEAAGISGKLEGFKWPDK
jgi:hypothetical protein